MNCKKHLSSYNQVSKPGVRTHGYFMYYCQQCKRRYLIWLEEGVEDTRPDCTRERQPCPFIVRCACGGEAQHSPTGNHRDVGLNSYSPMPAGAIYFAYDEGEGPQIMGRLSTYKA